MINLGITKQKILREIEGEPKHGYEIGKNLKLNTSTIYEHIEDLENEGFVLGEKTGGEKGKIIYQLTERGEKLVDALFDER